mgnify:CR=1 FL=1
MTRQTYKVIPAPAKGLKAAGIKGAAARFAHALEEVMNEMAAQGWEYLRADILPSEERQGLASTHTVYRSVLVFRRTEGPARQDAPEPAASPAMAPAPADPPPEADAEPKSEADPEAGPGSDPAAAAGDSGAETAGDAAGPAPKT